MPRQARLDVPGGQIITTVIFTDGLQRVIQTKKDADVAGTPGMTVSGKVVYDALGRVIEQDQPDFLAGKTY